MKKYSYSVKKSTDISKSHGPTKRLYSLHGLHNQSGMTSEHNLLNKPTNMTDIRYNALLSFNDNRR
jgi:hypothetical protein